ncbi:MAG: MATE family efflux transporter [Bacteroidetes bacterium HGW-Bacteroidetes-2]|jgi:putative MATE family efflux protein|nr:MAG: MATE family efflux transporter [Bacteroidetes bacterium HGW-Bacteroidetes-2]
MKTSLSFKNINRLAIPAILAGIAEPIISATDAAIVGNLSLNGTEALAAVGIVGSFLSALIWILGQTRSAISAIISQYLGAGKLNELKNLPAQAIYLNVGLSILILLSTIFFVDGIFKLYNASGLVLEYSVSYYYIRVWGFPFTLFTFAIFGIFRGLQNTFWPMIVALIGAVTNVGLDFALVYGISGWIEPMHIQGAAWASLISQALMAVVSLVLLLWKTTISLKIRFPLHPELYRLVGMALNLFLRSVALNTAIYFSNAFATDYGTTYIAAQTIALNLWLFSAFFIDGYASSGNIISGKLLGAKKYDQLWLLSKKVVVYGLAVSILLMFVGWLFYEPLGLIFTKDQEVLYKFKEIFFIVLLVQPINAIAFIFDGIFKGLGEMKYLRNVLLSATFLGFLPVLFLCDYLGLELYGIWIAFVVWASIRGGALAYKFRKMIKPKILHPF